MLYTWRQHWPDFEAGFWRAWEGRRAISPRITDAWFFYTRCLKKTLNLGATEYGDGSFKEKPSVTMAEIKEECVDLAGWPLIAFVAINGLRVKAATDGQRAQIDEAIETLNEIVEKGFDSWVIADALQQRLKALEEELEVE